MHLVAYGGRVGLAPGRAHEVAIEDKNAQILELEAKRAELWRRLEETKRQRLAPDQPLLSQTQPLPELKSCSSTGVLFPRPAAAGSSLPDGVGAPAPVACSTGDGGSAVATDAAMFAGAVRNADAGGGAPKTRSKRPRAVTAGGSAVAAAAMARTAAHAQGVASRLGLSVKRSAVTIALDARDDPGGCGGAPAVGRQEGRVKIAAAHKLATSHTALSSAVAAAAHAHPPPRGAPPLFAASKPSAAVLSASTRYAATSTATVAGESTAGSAAAAAATSVYAVGSGVAVTTTAAAASIHVRTKLDILPVMGSNGAGVFENFARTAAELPGVPMTNTEDEEATAPGVAPSNGVNDAAPETSSGAPTAGGSRSLVLPVFSLPRVRGAEHSLAAQLAADAGSDAAATAIRDVAPKAGEPGGRPLFVHRLPGADRPRDMRAWLTERKACAQTMAELGLSEEELTELESELAAESIARRAAYRAERAAARATAAAAVARRAARPARVTTFSSRRHPTRVTHAPRRQRHLCRRRHHRWTRPARRNLWGRPTAARPSSRDSAAPWRARRFPRSRWAGGSSTAAHVWR